MQYGLLEFYISLFTICGLVSAAYPKLRALGIEKNRAKHGAPKISSKQLDAFCWFAFLSLTSMGILLPIVVHLITSFTSSQVIFNNPLWEFSFIIFYSLGLMLIPERLRINEHGGFSVELRRSFYEIILFSCWISPFKAVKRGEIFSPFIFLVVLPLLFFYILKVSPALIISIIPFLILFSVIFDLSKAEKNTS